MEFQIACEVVDVDIVISPRKPSLCSAEIPFVADMQLQVDFAYWKFWGFVRDFAKGDDLSAPLRVSAHYETAFFCCLCFFWYLGLNLATDVVFRSGRHLIYGHAQSKLLRFLKIWEIHMYLKILHCISVDEFQILWCPAKASSYLLYGSLDFREGFIHNRHKSFTALPERARTVSLGSQAEP